MNLKENYQVLLGLYILKTTESTPSQPIQSTSSKTIIDIDPTSTFLESNSLNTETSQTSIEFEQDQTTTFYSVPPSPIQILDSRSAPVSPIIPPTLFNTSSTSPNILLLITVYRNIEQSSSSSYILLYSQLDTSNNFSSKFSSISISTQYIVPLSPLVLSTTYYTINYNIKTSYQPNIEQSLLYLQFDEATWNTFHTDNYNAKTQYTSIYSNITDLEETTQTPINNQSDSNSEQSFGKAYTAILNQVQPFNNNTDNQDLSSNYPAFDEESNLSDTIENLRKNFEGKVALCFEYLIVKQLTELNQNQGYCNKYYQDIDKLTLPNNPEEGLSNSFIVTTKVFNQPIEDIKGKQPQYDTEMPVENNKTLQQIVECLEARS
ncbi:4709_t:CDS:2 [Gigaspora margarita]|uniref:4709_t:CDS:1 n=1 Tax=Gigaspora margarita TaxID=4874 RepID=A0ABM8W543_GIGMA|nr:4709_t:CDS:2 [Gigaspora margarita]